MKCLISINAEILYYKPVWYFPLNLVYIPGKGGVRIEDTVVLTEDGARALNGVKKQLIEIV